MHVRDAVESDAEALATRVELSTDAVRQLIHDRTVCVVDEHGTADESAREGPVAGDPRGFLAFDADEGTVHVTQVVGDREAISLLLDEPIRFASNEGMAVEVFVPDSQSTALEAVEAAGFDCVGERQRFDGEPIHRYRLDAG